MWFSSNQNHRKIILNHHGECEQKMELHGLLF